MSKEVNKPTMKERIFKWICDNSHPVAPLTDIKQTNISFRKTSYRNQYYFTYGSWMSPYTMKRWLEIAEGKLYDSWKITHGDWYWIKDGKIIN